MKWAETNVRAPKSERELVASVLEDVGAAGVVFDDETEDEAHVSVTAYLADDEDLAGRLADLDTRLAGLAEVDGFAPRDYLVTVRHVQDSDWENNWKEYFHTQRVGEKIVIQPSWESYEPKAGDIVLKLDPESAFGTGTHPTTAMCLRALEKMVQPGATVFDVGTGSGVLAIAAAKLGAGRVVACDYAKNAAEVAAKNVAESGVADTVETGVSDLLAGFSGQADLIVANIIADIIIRLFDDVKRYLAAGGRLLVSGIIDERLADVKAAAAAKGLTILATYKDSGWVALVLGDAA